jgi:hypothetical protein
METTKTQNHFWLSKMTKSIAQKMRRLLEPEVVEISFPDGMQHPSNYTYTKIGHKKVA